MGASLLDDVSEILYEALAARHGIEVAVNDVEAFKRRAYSIRRNNPDFQSLALRTCPTDPEGRLWITHQGKPNGQDADEEHHQHG